MHAAFFANVVHANDVGVVQAGRDSGFEVEAVQVTFVGYFFSRQNLDRSKLIGDPVTCQINAAHTAGAKVFQQFELAEKEAFVFAGQKLVRLPFGDQRTLDQVFGQTGSGDGLPGFLGFLFG